MRGVIWEVIAEIGVELHPERLNVVATRIAKLNSVNDFNKVKSSFGPSTELDRSL